MITLPTPARRRSRSSPLLAARHLGARPALAEQSGRADVVISLDGSISPRYLPRHRPAPVSLKLSGDVRGTEGARPPQLQRSTSPSAPAAASIPRVSRCSRARLRNATQHQALARCRGALVGRGEISAEVPLNPVDPDDRPRRVLAFNGRSDGRPAVWVHAYSASPPVSFVLPFYLRRLPPAPTAC